MFLHASGGSGVKNSSLEFQREFRSNPHCAERRFHMPGCTAKQYLTVSFLMFLCIIVHDSCTVVRYCAGCHLVLTVGGLSLGVLGVCMCTQFLHRRLLLCRFRLCFQSHPLKVRLKDIVCTCVRDSYTVRVLEFYCAIHFHPLRGLGQRGPLTNQTLMRVSFHAATPLVISTMAQFMILVFNL